MTSGMVAATGTIKKDIQGPAGAVWRYFLRPNQQDAADFANQDPPQHAGEAVFSVRDDGQVDTYLFF